MHPEWSAPCNINRILAVIYGVFLILAIVFAVISSKMLRKVKKRIEEDFFAAIKTKESGLNKYTNNLYLQKSMIGFGIKVTQMNQEVKETPEEKKHRIF